MRQFFEDAREPLLWWLGTVVVGGLLTALGLRDLGEGVLGIYIVIVVMSALWALLKTWGNAARRADGLSAGLIRAASLTDNERTRIIETMERAGRIYSLFLAYYLDETVNANTSQEWKTEVRRLCDEQWQAATTMQYMGTIRFPLETIVQQSVATLELIDSGWFDSRQNVAVPPGIPEGQFTLHHHVDVIRWARDGIMAHANILLGRESSEFALPLKPPWPETRPEAPVILGLPRSSRSKWNQGT